MQKISFNQDWRFYLGDPHDARNPNPDDSFWRTLDLPHDWSIELERSPEAPSGVSGGFFPMGRGWYMKRFTPPPDWQGQRVWIEFEGVYMDADVWLNENFLGRHPYGYTSFLYDLTPTLKPNVENFIRVCVDNSHQLNSRWYSGSGIYRPVWLRVGGPVRVAPWGIIVTTPQVAEESATVRIVTRVVNDSNEARSVAVQSQITGKNRTVAAHEARATVGAGAQLDIPEEIHISAPLVWPWSPDSPTLYHLKTRLLVDGQVADAEDTHFGIRSIQVDAERGFLLNGQPLKLKGGCVHHDNGILGSASYARSEERKVEVHKASGYNAIRTAHNPPAPAFLDACDRLGMLVMDEAFDCWREGKNPGDYHAAFDDWWQRDVESMVVRDRNHPSVVFWSIGNEVLERDGRGGGAEIARGLAELVRKLDPTRPVTSAICGIWGGDHTWEDTDAVFASLDVGGYNYQWREYAPDHQRHPRRVMFGTESFPIEAYENWKCVTENPYVIGDFVWTSLDYLGESGIGRANVEDEKSFSLGEFPWHQANCGDLDLCGFKRPQSYYRDVVWGRGEKLYIAAHFPLPEGKTQETITRWGWPDVADSWTWPGREGRTVKVDVYSACEQVELFLNGKSLGVQPSGPAEKLTASFEVRYEPGELKAVGLVGGKPAAECALSTAAEPSALRLSPDHPVIKAETDGLRGLAYVAVELVDASGRIHPAADRPVYFTVKGAGTLIAVGSADPVSEESYTGNWRSTFRGRCLVVLKSDGAPGEIHLRAQADGVDGAEVVVRVE